MIKKNGSYTTQRNENMRGGDGAVVIEHLLTPDELYNKGRLYARVTLEPGCSIGHHVHEGEMESYYIVSGEGEVDDNGELVQVSVGDSVLTLNGEGHSIKNIGKTTLEFIALIIYN
ncbi:MAG: cupin domain-containing protein [Oscillospiraceae bacterium]|jgi:mannose-6-phosphate isomerase-like protein (cupin superfamily)|nr:cupin domain-containing protein [Oscillospiraceae bacterium]